MPDVVTVWIAMCSLVGLIWVSRHFELTRARRAQRHLGSRSYEGPPHPAPRVSVLVAAKDEEANIAPCVQTLLRQDYPNYEVIIIDDRSTDRTGEILSGLAAGANGKLKVISVRTLRDGWFGKTNAMREGVERADGEWLCFADADCRQTSDRTLSMAVREAAENRVDFLSVLPVLEARSFWERLLQPVCAAIMVLWFHPKRVNDPKHPAAYANGAFMLIKRTCYNALGGHERVRTEVNEDMHLARLAKQARFKLWVIQNKDLYVTRMYSSLGETWRGWSRIFYGCFGTFRRLALTWGVLLMVSVFPWISLAAGVVGGLVSSPANAGHWWTLAVVAAVAIVFEQSVTFRFYKLVRSGPAWSFLYILGAVLCLGMLVNAMLKLGGATKTVWRGTTYRGDRLEAQPLDVG